MYRLLAVAGENRERRRQRTHPARKKPELIATAPNQVWSWDITKLQGPDARRLLRAVRDHRHLLPLRRGVDGVAGRDRRARRSVHRRHPRHATASSRDQLTLHADRGTSMTSKPVAQLLVDLGVARSHSRPHVSNDNPYSRGELQDPQVLPGVPRPVRLDRRRPRVLRRVLRSLQPRPPPRRHRAAHPGVGPLRHRRRDPRPTRRHPRRRLRRQPGPVRAPPTRRHRSCPPSPGSTNPPPKHSSNPHEKLSHRA